MGGFKDSVSRGAETRHMTRKSPHAGHGAVLSVVLMSSFLTTFAASSLNVSIPSMGAEFAMPTALMGWIVSAFMIVTVSLMLPFGRLGDLVGRRPFMLAGEALVCASAVLLCFSSSWQAVLALRAFQGLGTACLQSSAQAIVADEYPPEHRGAALGLSVAFVYLGSSTGPVIGGLITQCLGWRFIFVLIALIAILAFVVGFLRLPRKRLLPKQGKAAYLKDNLDVPGIVLYMLACAPLTVGISAVSASGCAWVLVVLGIAALLALVRWETRAAHPLVDPGLFTAGPNFLLSNLSALLNYAATFAISYLLSIYLQSVLGLGSGLAGLVLLAAPVVQIFVSPLAGRLSDRVSPFVLSSIGMGVCTACLLLLCAIDTESPLAYLVFCLVVKGIGIALFSSPNNNAILSLVPREHYGIGASFTNIMRNTGNVCSMAVIGAIAAALLGDATIAGSDPAAICGTIHVCFTFFACVGAVGVFTSLGRRKRSGGRA